MKLNRLLRNTLNRVFPIIHQIEEEPIVTIKREVTPAGDPSDPNFLEKPYAGKNYETFDVQCIFVEEPLIIETGNQVFIKKQMVFYIKKEDVDFDLTLNDRLIFQKTEYKPTKIQEIFPLLKIYVEKTSA